MDIFFVFPIHLFFNIDKLKNKTVYLLEEPIFFTKFKFHKLKLAYHRATMKSYYQYLVNNKIEVKYIEFNSITKDFYKSYKKIYMYDPCEKLLVKKLKDAIPNIVIFETLNFLVNEKEIKDNVNEFYKNGKYVHKNFYIWQRKRLNILMNGDKPINGIWSYDTSNRKKLPKNIKIVNISDDEKNTIKEEAVEYVNKHFSKNYGSLDNFIYPINHKDTVKWLKAFIKHKFKEFGPYEDAISNKDVFIFHSGLSPMMNIGLITDKEVISYIMKYKNKIPIESFEGFIRQVIGWRNYMYATYVLESDNLQKSNFFNHTIKLDKKKMWGVKSTNLPPVDDAIKKIVNYGYAHHIERLMILGNYMLLCMIHPKDVYNIFMEWTIDAYEWVMIPNIYGMSQYSSNIMTRPYFCSANYILKMSDYKKGEWCLLWNAIYYNFINVHQKVLEKNYATSRQVAFWKNKSDSDKKEYLDIAKKYLNS